MIETFDTSAARLDGMSPPPERLPKGRQHLDPAFVAAHQRERLLRAVGEVLYEVGYPRASVAAICERAAVSKRAFYRQFSGREACLSAAFDAAHLELRQAVQEACAGEKDWALGVHAALAALIDRLVADPPLARLVLVEAQRAGHSMFDRYQAAVEGFVPLLAKGAPRPEAIHALGIVDEATVGGVATLLGGHVLKADLDLPALLSQLSEFALTPYLGSAAAREVARAAPGQSQ